jgi:peptidoglycan/xylan/chitin deacetylase (PgdA/CDA1 family)
VRTFIPVLLYHSVNYRAAVDDREWTVSPGEFASHLNVVAASGRTPVTLGAIADALRRERPLPPRPVAITFDDGFADSYEALTAVADRGLVATIYITTGEIGAASRLTPSQVAEVATWAAVDVGAHAVSHRRLDELGQGDLEEEVTASRQWLEDVSQTRVESFAYPHGAYDGRVRRAVVAAGYRSAAGVKNALSHERDDPFAIARWTVRAGTPATRVAEVLDGKRVPSAWARERLRTRAYRWARRGRRRVMGRLAA